MNVIEIILLVVSAICLFVFLSEKEVNHRFSMGLVIFSTFILFYHLLFGFIRWQLYPLYLLLVLSIILLTIKSYDLASLKKHLQIIINVLFIIAFILSVFALFAFPIYEIPTPSGSYQIGTTYYTVEDETREELYSDATFRKIMVQLWYPAETTEGYEVAPWLEGGQTLSRALASDNYLPAFALDHAVNVMSNAYYDAPVNSDQDTYPIVVISHGWRGFRTLHTDFAEELASQGYIVVSIDHTYGSAATVFDDQDVAFLNLDALPPRESNPNFLEDANQLVYTYSGDIVTTLDYLEILNTNDPLFQGRLDLETIGLLGHSTGGGAGVATALDDARVDAVFGLDAWVEPIGQETLNNGLSVPSVFLRSGSWETGENNEYLYNLVENSVNPTDLYQINGTTHLDFAMVYMYSPLTKVIGFTGSVESEKLTLMLKTMILEFFNNHLMSQDVNIDIDQWEEVIEVNIP